MSAVASARARANRSRRLFFAGLALGGLLVAIMVPLVFAWPGGQSRDDEIEPGSAGDYSIGSVTQVVEGRFYLTRPSDETFLALSWREPGRGCTIPWRPTFVFEGEQGWFRDPCSGSTFDREGHRVSGPAPRDMDRYVVTIVNDEITVDTSVYVCGFAPPDAPCEAAAP